MEDYLNDLAAGTLNEDIQLFYNFDYNFDRVNSTYGSTSGSLEVRMLNDTQAQKDLATTLSNQISCTESGLKSTFPANVNIT